jgi:hypothetical protein
MSRYALGFAIVPVCLFLSDPGPATLTFTPTYAPTESPTLTPTATPTPLRQTWLPLLLKSCCLTPPTATPTGTVTATAAPTMTATAMPADVRVAPGCSQWDAPGNDNDNLNEEYVCLENRGASAADMTGWHIRDAANYTYTFPAFTLAAGAPVRLHSGSGTDTATELYWGRGQAVWNNGGDTVYLYDAGWALVDQYTY